MIEHAGYKQINSGRVLAHLLGIAPVPQSDRATFQKAALKFISEPDGPKVLAAALAKDIQLVDHDRIVVDGIRHPETLSELRDLSPSPVALIYVYTPPDVAFEMFRMREDYGYDKIDFDAFIELYNAPVEGQVRYLIQDADVILYNWIGLSEYEKTIDEMLTKVGLKTC
ncbi:hypothetical protein ROR02_05880 [Pararhodospirillum oryzae]|uniref:Uncharacterized protein n=1 Tax=Pararhodospirillum oryzae TaxID=478448 RepID=A0A512H4U6_9PROT|nr:hypothetical protein ROR02_05880 [Pararhodospirillum oryzae]